MPVSALGDFLTSATTEPSALVIEGEAGIGKTTLWLTGVEQARGQGFTVLVARPVAAESVLAYASFADLLGGVDPSAWARLPEPQRRAVDQILSRADGDGGSSDQHAVAAGFLAVIESVAEDAPLLLAIDDLQWLDTSSAQVIAFAARRLSSRVGLLATMRTHGDSADAASWLQLPRPDAVRRISVPTMSLGGLHGMLAERLGRSFSRPTLVRIMEISGGNPFYALELARVIDGSGGRGESALPGSLAELVRARIGGLGDDVREVLLAAACLAGPTVPVVVRASGTDAARVVKLLEQAEANGIIALDGQRLRFTHPLLAHGVYAGAAAASRRHMHRRLADIVVEPELQARHLALAATSADPHVLQSLDTAAETARKRGAPAAAAELIDLARGLGGDIPERRMRSADYHYTAGDPERARALLEGTIEVLAPGGLRAEASSLLADVCLSEDNFPEAVGLLERAVVEAGDDLTLKVQMLISLSYAQVNSGQIAGAMSIEDAVTRAERLGNPHLLSQALGFRVMMGFVAGNGIDHFSLRRALELEDPHADTPLGVRATPQNALLLAWTGQLDLAGKEMAAVRRRCIERGEENDVIVVAFHSVMFAIWRGDFAEAALIAEDAMERALQLNRDHPLFGALMMRATLAAYGGRGTEARRDIDEVFAAAERFGTPRTVGWAIAALGFLEVSLGNFGAASKVLEPLLTTLGEPYGTEMVTASFLPDAMEALIALGRLGEAEPFVDRLERDGRRLDRAWMLAMGARCRAMILAAQGDLEAASFAAQQAMSQHDRLPMPFERARTQLLLGQLLRRQKQKDLASATMRESLATFEALNTPLWAEKARAALARSNVGPKTSPGLTPSEQRVAELAASGMTNREVAAELFISAKTVEANLSRVYHKLGIRSRAELGRLMGATPPD